MKIRCIFATSLFLAVLLGCASTDGRRSYRAGKQDAKSDVSKGILAIEELGWPPPSEHEYTQLLDRQYSITVRRVGYCVVSEQTDEHARGYNKVAEAEIERRFGKKVLEKAVEQAQKSYEAKKELH